MPWPTPAEMCHSTGTSSAASACVEWNSACDRDELVGVAVHQQHRRARADLRLVALDVRIAFEHQHARIADDRGGRHRAAQPDMQRHHGALGKADQRERGGRQLVARKLGVEECVKHRAPPC